MQGKTTCLLGLFMGAAIGLLLADLLGSLHEYRSSRPLMLKHSSGMTAVLPSGTLFLSQDALRNNWDLGWWGCVPVGFPSEGAAIDMGLSPVTDVELIDFFAYGVEVATTDG